MQSLNLHWLYNNHLLWGIPIWEYKYYCRVLGMKRYSCKSLYLAIHNKYCLHREVVASTFCLSHLGVNFFILSSFQKCIHFLFKWFFPKISAIYFFPKIRLPLPLFCLVLLCCVTPPLSWVSFSPSISTRSFCMTVKHYIPLIYLRIHNTAFNVFTTSILLP